MLLLQNKSEGNKAAYKDADGILDEAGCDWEKLPFKILSRQIKLS